MPRNEWPPHEVAAFNARLVTRGEACRIAGVETPGDADSPDVRDQLSRMTDQLSQAVRIIGEYHDWIRGIEHRLVDLSEEVRVIRRAVADS